jgi:pimeloyl-ACP methyl ester carboxylesterase
MQTEDVRFDSDGCALAGTCLRPTAPVAAALLIPGSGRTDRDSDTRRYKLGVTRAVADSLALVGVSTLRFDKRGVGASEGDYLSTGMTQRLTDARAALGWLAATAPGLPLLVIGHSEGALHAAELGAEDGVAGVALLSMSTRRGEDVLAWQTRMLADRLPRVTRMVVRIARMDVVRTQRRNMERVRASSADTLRIQGVRVNARWLREFMAHDPTPALARITVPVLAITGGQDLQVPPADIQTMRELVRGPFEGHVVDNLSHILRSDPDGIGPRGYRRAARKPVSPEALALVTDWVTRHWQQP